MPKAYSRTIAMTNGGRVPPVSKQRRDMSASKNQSPFTFLHAKRASDREESPGRAETGLAGPSG